MFSYEFHLDGTIDVSVRASGYFQGQYYAGNEEYGYRVHDALSGSMHDHTLNFKADFDILGTANTAQLTSFVPVNQKYIWSDTPRQTMKLQREFVESEDDSRLVWYLALGATHAAKHVLSCLT
jgi:primary-amine oxidase